MDNITIGVEGYVGSGKTSMCEKLLDLIPNSILLHGGNLYRAIVYVFLKNNSKLKDIDLEKAEDKEKLATEVSNVDIEKLMEDEKIEIKIIERQTEYYVNGEKITDEEIQSKKISMAVSIIVGSANNKNFFINIRKVIDDMKKEHSIILSGRLLMNIYPDLDYHFMITASIEERTKRKALQYGVLNKEDMKKTYDELLETDKKEELEKIKYHILDRDMYQGAAGLYDLSPKTILLDFTDGKDANESAKMVYEKIKSK